MSCLALVALSAGCSSSQENSSVPGRCGTGPMTPVTVKELVSTFRANHVSLKDEHSCSSPPYLAEASNADVAVGARQEHVTAQQGDVVCTIDPDSHGVRVRRVHYSGDAMTWVSTLNVICAVFPSDDAHAAAQIGAVQRSLRALARIHPEG